jgi:ABC-type bacteriocin/lantibiotic exporter with double-glycine peptidase domain
MAGILWAQAQGMYVRVYEPFDYQQFAQKGEQYLFEEYGQEVANEQIKNSLISQEIELAKEYIQKINITKAPPNLDKIKSLLQAGYLLLCNVNSQSLVGKKGYTGHFVVVNGFDKSHLFIHNPGLPPRENQQVSFSQFNQGWAYPNDKAKNIIALRKK